MVLEDFLFSVFSPIFIHDINLGDQEKRYMKLKNKEATESGTAADCWRIFAWTESFFFFFFGLYEKLQIVGMEGEKKRHFDHVGLHFELPPKLLS